MIVLKHQHSHTIAEQFLGFFHAFYNTELSVWVLIQVDTTLHLALILQQSPSFPLLFNLMGISLHPCWYWHIKLIFMNWGTNVFLYSRSGNKSFTLTYFWSICWVENSVGTRGNGQNCLLVVGWPDRHRLINESSAKWPTEDPSSSFKHYSQLLCLVWPQATVCTMLWPAKYIMILLKDSQRLASLDCG